MSDCSKHKKEVAGISDMKVLAEMIGDLHYGTLTELLNLLSDKLYDDGVNDFEQGKRQLAYKLYKASDRMYNAYTQIKKAYQISKPFMENKNKNQ